MAIRALCAVIIEQQGGAILSGEILFKGKNLPAISERILREQPQLGQGVEGAAARFHFVHGVEEKLGRLRKFDFGSVKERVLGGSGQLFFDRRQLDDLDTVQGPPMRMRHLFYFVPCFRQADVKHLFTAARALEKKLERERRLAAARLTLNQVKPASGNPATEDVVESRDSGFHSRIVGRVLFAHKPAILRRERNSRY